MSGSVWPSLVAGAKAKASEVENKFDWMEGDFLPFNAGVKTDSTYDLGSASFKWIDIWGTGRLYVGAGAAATPSVARWDFQGSGMWWPDATTLAWSLGGSEKMRLTSDNKLGLGLTPGVADWISVVTSYVAAAGVKLENTNSTGASRLYGVADGCAVYIVAAGTTQAGNHWSGGPAIADSAYLQGANESNFLIIATAQHQYWRTSNASGNWHMVADTTETWTNAIGVVTQPLQPSFLAYNSADDNNVTGNGTYYQVVFNTETYDQNADYNSGTGVFTAPTTGRFLLTANVGLLGYSAAINDISIQIVTSNRTFRRAHLFDVNAASTIQALNVSVIADMDNADTAYVQIMANGMGADNADVEGDAGSISATFFSASLIN